MLLQQSGAQSDSTASFISDFETGKPQPSSNFRTIQGPMLNGEPYSVVQWESASFFTVAEDETTVQDGKTRLTPMVLILSRLGNLSHSSRVKWGTADISAVAGKQYVPVVDQIVDFAPGEPYKEVEVMIIPPTQYSGGC